MNDSKPQNKDEHVLAIRKFIYQVLSENFVRSDGEVNEILSEQPSDQLDRMPNNADA